MHKTFLPPLWGKVRMGGISRKKGFFMLPCEDR